MERVYFRAWMNYVCVRGIILWRSGIFEIFPSSSFAIEKSNRFDYAVGHVQVIPKTNKKDEWNSFFYRNEREWFTQQLKTKAVHSQFELESDSHFSWARQHFQFIQMFWGKFNISAKTFLQKRNVELLKLWKMLWKSSWRFGFNYKSPAVMRVC